jgi:hypothetical protein
MKYVNPYPINIITNLVRHQNLELITQICDKHNVTDTKKQEILDKLLKPNYYTPLIINSEFKEKLQQII